MGGGVQDKNYVNDNRETPLENQKETPLVPPLIPLQPKETLQLEEEVAGPSKEITSKDFIWPLESRISINSSIAEIDPQEGYSKANKVLDINEIPEVIDSEELPSSYNETISEIDVSDNEDSTESLTQRSMPEFKSTHEMKSVEDYIQEQTSSTNIQEIKSKMSTRKRRKPHVQYSEIEAVPATAGTESHELKPIRHTSAEEKNLISLDSDMQMVDKRNIDHSNDPPTPNSSNTS